MDLLICALYVKQPKIFLVSQEDMADISELT